MSKTETPLELLKTQKHWECTECGTDKFFISQGIEGGVPVRWAIEIICTGCGCSDNWGS